MPGVLAVEPVILRFPGASPRATAETAHPAALASNDELIWSQWGHFSVNATDAWEITRGAGVVVAVIDTGVDATHEDLVGQVLPGIDFFSGDDDAADESGHGTHVAGTIAAKRNNSVGGTGIAPEASILPVRVCGSGPTDGCPNTLIADGIEWAVDHGADVINLSIRGFTGSLREQEAVAYAIAHDVIVVAATGNDGIDALTYPAAYPGVIGVGALTPGGDTAWFSTTGSHVDVVAPGVEVLSTIAGIYAFSEGTSMAAPHVAAVAALLRAANPEFTQAQVSDRIINTAIDIGDPGHDLSSGGGRLDAYRALTNGDDPDGDYFELEVAHTFVGDLRIEVLRDGDPQRLLFWPRPSPYAADADVRIRYSLPDLGLAAVPGAWTLGVADSLPGQTGSIVAFRVGSNGVIYSYVGPPVAIPDGTGKFVFVDAVVPNVDSTLAELSLSAGALTPVFEPATTSYTAAVGNEVASVAVIATAADPNATLAIDGHPATSGIAQAVALNVGATPIDVVVTAPDRVTTETYTVTVTRVAPTPSSDATLSGLLLAEGTLDPAFAPGTASYSANVPNAVMSVQVTATTTDGAATLRINDAAASSGIPRSVPLAVGANLIDVAVVAEDGVSNQTYVVTVTRAAPPASDDATLSALSLSSGVLSPTFDPLALTYTTSVPNAVSSVIVTATLANPAATLTVNGDANPTVALAVGTNAIAVVVTAQDGVTALAYSITVNRAAAPPPPPPGGGGGGGGGGAAVQTITPSLKVINDDGGRAAVDDFEVLLDGDPIPLDVATTGGSRLNHLTVAGPTTLYVISFSGDCDSRGFFSLSFGDEFDCAIVADDLPLTQVAGIPIPFAETLIEESLSLTTDAFLLNGRLTVRASTAETPPRFSVAIPATAVSGQSRITVLVTSGNSDLARFNPPPGTRFVAGSAYDVAVLGSSGQPIASFPTAIILSFLTPAGTDPQRLAAYFFDADAGAWVPIGGLFHGSRVDVTATHLSTFALFEFAVGGGLNGKLPPSGISLTSAAGGTLGQLDQALAQAGATAVFISYGGQLIGYQRQAPTFVNAQFVAVTGGILNPGQPVLVVLAR